MIRILVLLIILISGTTLHSYAVGDGGGSTSTTYFRAGKAAFADQTLNGGADSVSILMSVASEEPLLPRWAIKTNGLYYVVGALNVSGEYYWGDRYSANLAVVYSPYTLARNYKFRLLIFEPEVRYWLGRHSVGHVVGVYGQLGYYNVAVHSDWRYQDKGGNTPAIGLGVSYGYSLALAKQWRLEFNIGLGYTHFQYDKFYNIPNGAFYESTTKNYWGLSKAGVCLSYLFNNRKK